MIFGGFISYDIFNAGNLKQRHIYFVIELSLVESSQLLEALRPHLAKEQKLEEGTLSAVLVIIHFLNGRPHVLLTKRSNALKNHAGEISCPGGTYLDSDKDLMHTAIRETREEIGIRIDERDVVGCLRGVHTLTSNFTIVPYIAIIDKIKTPKPNINEIDEVIDVPLIELLKTVERDLDHASFGEVYKFVYDDNIVWGATARILKQIYDILHKSGMV
jgi:8-oxo-dGTP pyrophosphatase MutT (NUDIX family)